MPEPTHIEVFVPGTPKAQPRVKATRRGSFAGVYDPGTAKAWKENAKAVLLPLVPSEPIAGEVKLALCFLMPRPKGHYNSKGEVKPRCISVGHTKKPDLDNMVKAIMDAISDLCIWRDDSQVVKIECDKKYATDMPGVLIELMSRGDA